MANTRIDVRGMTCDHCRARVDNAVKTVDGVWGVYVDLAGGFAEVDFDEGKTTNGKIIEAVQAAGYEAEIAD